MSGWSRNKWGDEEIVIGPLRIIAYNGAWWIEFADPEPGQPRAVPPVKIDRGMVRPATDAHGAKSEALRRAHAWITSRIASLEAARAEIELAQLCHHEDE